MNIFPFAKGQIEPALSILQGIETRFCRVAGGGNARKYPDLSSQFFQFYIRVNEAIPPDVIEYFSISSQYGCFLNPSQES